MLLTITLKSKIIQIKKLKKNIIKSFSTNALVKEPESYRFYDSPEYNPKPLKQLMNTWKPVLTFVNNLWGDLQEVLLKNSKWFVFWKPWILFWKKKNFLFISRDLSNLKVFGTGPINLKKYLELPFGISSSAFWHTYLILRVNNPEYKWLWIEVKNKDIIMDEIFQKIFKTKNVTIFNFNFENKHIVYTILVRCKRFNCLSFNLYGFKCTFDDKIQLSHYLTKYRQSKKKWVWFNYENEDFIYYIHTDNKRMVFYQHINGVVKKIGKNQFDLLKQTLPVKQKKNKVFEDIIN